MGNDAPKVLLVEDDRLLRKAADTALRERGYAVVTAADGVAALQAARAERPDLILLDLIMPRLHGCEVLRALKADAQLADVPVLVLTNLGAESDKQVVAQAGAADYLIKASLSLEDLMRRVDEALRAR